MKAPFTERMHCGDATLNLMTVLSFHPLRDLHLEGRSGSLPAARIYPSYFFSYTSLGPARRRGGIAVTQP